MSKVICDLCGTAYADTADQCPICGTAKSEATRPAGGEEAGAGYAYVKGGRFSQANVRKHNSGNGELPRVTDEKPEKVDRPAKPVREEPVEASVPAQRPRRRPEREEPQDEQPSNTGLIIIVIILILAIIAVSAYIAIRIGELSENRNTTGSTQSTATTLPTDPGSTGSNEIPCTGLIIDGPSAHTFTQLGEMLQVSVSCEPADTTDLLNWNYDSEVVKVVQNGTQWQITPVAAGETVVIVTCGDFADTITITCDIPEETKPSEPPKPTEPQIILQLNRVDFTLRGYGSAWNLTVTEDYTGPADVTEITWTSSNPDVATVVNGKVTAVGNGSAIITAEWNGQKVTCIVYCRDVVPPADPTKQLSHTDATIPVGVSFVISLRDVATGVKIEGATFTVSEEGYFTVDEKGVVTGVAPTGNKIIYVIVTYQDVEYKCIVRVVEA